MFNTTLDAPISPELCLVDPELAARARLLLPTVSPFRSSKWLERPQPAVSAHGGSIARGLVRVRSNTRLWLLAVPMAVLSALIGADLGLRASETPKTVRAPESQTVTAPAAAPSAAATAQRPPAGSASSSGQRAGAVPTPPKAKPQPTPASVSAAAARAKSAGTPAAPRKTAAPAGVAPMVLRWAAFPGATLYDVILWQGHTRVLDLWPTTTHVTIPAVWTYKGKVFRRSAGVRYLWFVYAARGSKTAPRYVSLVRSGAF